MVWFWALVLLGFCCPSGILGEEFEIQTLPNTTTTVGRVTPVPDVVAELQSLVSQLMRRVEELEKKHEGGEVAFSAALHNIVEDVDRTFSREATLVFKNVITNAGNAYNQNTGIFTAPRRGMYFMHLTACRSRSRSVNCSLLKNGQTVFAVYDLADPDDKMNTHSCGSNGMALQLDQGDMLKVVLWRHQWVSDNSRLTTFSGFLLYPM